MRNICIASNNSHKIEEIEDLLGDQFNFISLEQIGFKGDIPETKETLAENSLEKANYINKLYNIDCIADDSGLEIEALGGEPGVYSARYAGEPSNSEKNIEKVLSKLQNEPNRKAKFKTVITLILDNEPHQFEGVIKGTILEEPRGQNGFGYDPIFLPEGKEKTFAEMTSEEKNPISHRGLAIKKLSDYLAKTK